MMKWIWIRIITILWIPKNCRAAHLMRALSLSLRLSVCLCLSLSVSVCLCLSLSVSVCLSMYVWTRLWSTYIWSACIPISRSTCRSGPKSVRMYCIDRQSQCVPCILQVCTHSLGRTPSLRSNAKHVLQQNRPVNGRLNFGLALCSIEWSIPKHSKRCQERHWCEARAHHWRSVLAILSSCQWNATLA